MSRQNTKLSCSICGEDNIVFSFKAQDYITKDYFNIHQCQKCTCGYTYPHLSTEELKKYYNQNYYGRRKSFTDKIINRLRVQKIYNIKPGPGTVVDVGCGNGLFLKEMEKEGWKIFGTEIAPSNHFSDKIKERICEKELPSCNYKDSYFDVVTMWHSLEHISNPLDYILEAKRILKDKGIIVIEVPNFLSVEGRATKKNWFHLDVPRHTIHFTPVALESLLASADLNIIKLEHFSVIYGFFGCFQSILNVLSKRKNLLFDFLNGKISAKKIASQHTLDGFINIFLFLPLAITSFILFLLETSIKRGGVITVLAQKN